jgi:hypothetical protein
VVDDIGVLMGSQGRGKGSEGREMKDDGVSLVFFRKLQSAE